jgi:hypothetical protein
MLTIELVPETAWFKNLRSELPKEKWDKLRKDTYKKAGYRCEVCGGKGEKWPVWTFEVADRYIREAFKLWNERSNYQWELDITVLDE